MITLFVIVVIATLVLAVTRAEGMRPLGLALVGMISLVLGARATAVFTDTSIVPLLSSMVQAQENTDVEPADDSAAGVKADEAADEAIAPEGSAAPASPRDQVAEDAVAKDPDAATDQAANVTGGQANDEKATDEPIETVESTVPDATQTEAAKTEATVEPDDSQDASPAIAPLSIEPKPTKVEAITNVQYLDRDDDTPNWLETKPWTKDGVRFVPVASRLQISEEDRDRALIQEKKEATDAYINELLRNKHATTLLKLQSVETLPKVMGSFQEQVVVTAGTMHQSHVLLAFDKDFKDAINVEWDKVQATSRLMQTGLGAGIVLLLLSTMFSYFKLDTATRGYYTGRLQFVAAAAILAVIAASVLFANYVPWM